MSIQLMNEGFARKYGITDDSVKPTRKVKQSKSLTENARKSVTRKSITESMKVKRTSGKPVFIHLTESQIKKINTLIKRISEGAMSDEDARDSEMLRGIANKITDRANAKLTPDEKALLDRLGVTVKKMSDGSGHILVDRQDITKVFRDISRDDRYNYAEKRNGGEYRGKTIAAHNGDYRKENRVDMVRKARTRKADDRDLRYDDDNYDSDLAIRHSYKTKHHANSVGNREDGYTVSTKSSKREVADVRERQDGVVSNRLSKGYREMQDLISTKKQSDTQMRNATDNLARRNRDTDDYYTKQIADAQRKLDSAKQSYEWAKQYNAERYDDETIGARKRKASAQDRIDTMLKKKKDEKFARPIRNSNRFNESRKCASRSRNAHK